MESTVLLIADLPDGFAVDIHEVAPLLPVSALSLRWSLDDADAPAEFVAVDTVAPKPRAPYSFSEMATFWQAISQTIWGTYVAAPDDATLATFSGQYLFRIAPTELLRFPFLLQAVDSSLFLIHSTDTDFLQQVESRFNKVAHCRHEP